MTTAGRQNPSLYTWLVTAVQTNDDKLNRWLTFVDREARRHTVIDRTLSGTSDGPLTLPIRYVFKVMEIGPSAATKLAVGIVRGRISQQ